MKRTILTYLALGALALTTACDSDDSIELAVDQSVQRFEAAGVQNMENDALFAAEAASAGMLQMQLSETALERGVSPDVREFAENTIRDHRQMMEELQEMAGKTNIVLPQTMGEAHQETYNEVKAKEGIAFDVAYINTMVSQHKTLLRRYEDMAEEGVNMDVKQYASRQLPIIRKHFGEADQLEDKLD